MSSTNHSGHDGETVGSADTDVYVGGVEMAVRTTSRFSRTVHIPAVDGRGDVTFDADGLPETKCGVESGREMLNRKLVPTYAAEGRDMCDNCDSTEQERSERNSKGAGNKSWARKARYGDDWGDAADGDDPS